MINPDPIKRPEDRGGRRRIKDRRVGVSRRVATEQRTGLRRRSGFDRRLQKGTPHGPEVRKPEHEPA